MTIYEATSIILTLSILMGYLNHRFIKMPATIAIMVGALLLSLILVGSSDLLGYHSIKDKAVLFLRPIDFHDLLINGMLSFLLFAGALNIDVQDLKHQKWAVGVLATVSTVASTLLVGFGIGELLGWVGIQLPLIYCLLFGALISPTDPIAVLAIFKGLGAPKSLSVIVECESLFNDGVAIVIFMTLYQLAFQQQSITFHAIFTLFMSQSLGGILYGMGLGILAYWLIKPLTDHNMALLVTLAIVMGGYSLAQSLNISGPLAMVVSGMFIGNRGRNFHMSKKICDNLYHFWNVIDELLNMVLFLLMGLELLVIDFSFPELIATVIAIPLVLLSRYITVWIPMRLIKLGPRRYASNTIHIMVWGGLRGGLAVALALALPGNQYRHLILVMTYAVVLFSIVVQGLSIKPLVKRSLLLSKSGVSR